MSKLNSLHDLYVHELKDLYSAEKQLTEALPKMFEAAHAEELKNAFRSHLGETERHLEQVQQLLQALGVNPGSTKCAAMEGLVEEGSEIIKAKAKPAVKDAALIAAAQRVEHYEIAGYGTARAFAEALGETEAMAALGDILNEESAANEKLTAIAIGGVNVEAISA